MNTVRVFVFILFSSNQFSIESATSSDHSVLANCNNISDSELAALVMLIILLASNVCNRRYFAIKSHIQLILQTQTTEMILLLKCD